MINNENDLELLRFIKKYTYNLDMYDNEKMLSLAKLIYHKNDKDATKEMSKFFSRNREFVCWDELSSLSEGTYKRKSKKFYKSPTEDDFKAKGKDNYSEESNHLEQTFSYIDKDIERQNDDLYPIESETWWMDYDQKTENLRRIRYNNKKNEQILSLQSIKDNPYFARIDLKSKSGDQSYYIGETPYICENSNYSILSIWSEIGKTFRNKRQNTYADQDGVSYNVILRRNIDIEDGKIRELYDVYSINSKASKKQITDTYLLKILEEKKNEKNITNIIRSIQQNQNTIIDYDFQKNIIVQGCAGSGKTMILLHRLANMKYNYPDYDYSKVKIITPNSNFNLFIDDLTKDLRLDKIEKMPLSEYWEDIIYRYRIQSGVKPYKRTNITYKSDNTQLKEKGIIYSADFAKILKRKVNDIPQKGLKYQKRINQSKENTIIFEENDIFKSQSTNEISGAETLLNKALEETFKHFGIYISVDEPIECVLYSKVLAIYYYYEKPLIASKDYMLCIDEGQDIPLLEYVLMLRVNGNQVILNVYGDINQTLPDNYNLKNWEMLERTLETKKYTLNENYRNSEEIIYYYNKKLSMNNKSFGLNTRPVKVISIKEFIWRVIISLVLKKRTAVIIQNDTLPEEIMPYCVYNELAIDKMATVLNVKESKGLEFDAVFVFDENLDNNEKYVSYTRALSELYIVIKE
ncbi:MAG: AAA family ATPase [Clostridia bacterium]|nr:AAA family ATPase [Clostridia bacterium]